ncbi:hypothetical protein FDZ71_02280, partial [bacterium]
MAGKCASILLFAAILLSCSRQSALLKPPMPDGAALTPDAASMLSMAQNGDVEAMWRLSIDFYRGDG